MEWLAVGRCRPISEEQRESALSPTGKPAYRFQFPEHFGVAELPHQRYWQLMPPLLNMSTASFVDRDSVEEMKVQRSDDQKRIRRTPNFAKSREATKAFARQAEDLISVDELRSKPSMNFISGVVKKTEKTDSAVNIRIRCESIEAHVAKWPTVCPAGSVLASYTFGADEIGAQETVVDLPSTFTELKGKPDLTIISSSISHRNPWQGQRVRYTATVKNLGDGLAPPSRVTLSDSES